MTREEMLRHRANALDGLDSKRQRDYIRQWLADANACRESRRVGSLGDYCECFCCEFRRFHIEATEASSW